MSVSSSMRAAVTRRAEFPCEYCHLPVGATKGTFHIDHVIARQHGGATALHNLALSCTRCNAHKGPNLSGIDPETGQLAAIFNPRADAVVLSLNHPERLAFREALIQAGILPQQELT